MTTQTKTSSERRHYRFRAFLRRRKRKLKGNGFDLATGIQAGILIVGILYCFFTYRLWQTSVESVHVGQRAYVLVEGINLLRPPNPGNVIEALLTIKNTGQTPAIGVIIRGDLHFLPRKPDHILRTEGGADSSGNLGQTQSSQYSLFLDGNANRTWTQADIDAISAHKFRLYATIIIDYRDVFGRANLTVACASYQRLYPFDAANATFGLDSGTCNQIQ